MTDDIRMDKWDLENAELREPSEKSKRVLVSVSLSRDDYDRISKLAKDSGRKISTYMRECSLADHSEILSPIIHTAGGAGAIASFVFTSETIGGGTLAPGYRADPEHPVVEAAG